ncbi:hypothetical protein B0H14DRAFT_3869668 [Mycena olivaceomarginata]|nr:hypothetical protein B0H14DRAFT_3869668 [Mycena olivaceomarginata]
MVQDLLRDSIAHTTFAYPAYAVSVLAGNDFFRSVTASVFPLFGRAFLVSLGLGPGYHVSIDALVDENRHLQVDSESVLPKSRQHYAAPAWELHHLELCAKTLCPMLAWLLTFDHPPNVDTVILPALPSPCNVTVVRAA